MKVKNKHVHKYEKTKIGDNYEVYKCALPGCTHYIAATLIIGRLSLCWGGCQNAVLMDNSLSKMKRPICDDCKELRRKQRELLRSIPEETTNEML